MKKVTPAIFIALLFIYFSSCKQKVVENTTIRKNALTSAAVRDSLLKGKYFTLNGLPFAKADSMVNSFLNYKGIYDATTPTCVWFSKVELKLIDSLVKQVPNSDGVRIYFARTIPDGKYTIVAVSTTDGGIDTSDTDKKRHIHNDQFQQDKPVLPNGLSPIGKIGDVTPAAGAILYNPLSSGAPCPPSLIICGSSKHYITCEVADTMVNIVGKEKINATSEWFDKGILESLYKVIPDGGGLRLYYARQMKKDPSDSVKRHGFIFILTKDTIPPKQQVHIQMDFYPCITIVSHYPNYLEKSNGGGADNGEECPTNCQVVTWP